MYLEYPVVGMIDFRRIMSLALVLALFPLKCRRVALVGISVHRLQVRCTVAHFLIAGNGQRSVRPAILKQILHSLTGSSTKSFCFAI